MNTLNVPTYSDGVPCHAGDLVWLCDGYLVAKVEQVLASKRIPVEGETEERDRKNLLMELSLFGQCSSPFYYCAESITRLTKTEELAVKILFHILGRQLGEVLWGNEEWCCHAKRERLTYEERGEGGYGGVWILSVARRARPEGMQEFRFNHITMSFTPTSEPWVPLPPLPPLYPHRWYELPTHRPRRCFVNSSGVRFMEGDLIWVDSDCPAASVERFERILLPTDSDAEWIVEDAEELTDDGKPAPLLVSQTTFVPEYNTFETAETKWYKSVNETEELALYLLIHLLKQHPEAHIEGWNEDIDFSYAPADDAERSATLPWCYVWSQWTVNLTFRNEPQDKIHSWRDFRFNCDTCEFTLTSDIRYPGILGRVL